MMFADSLLPGLEELARRAAEPVGVEVAWVEFKREGPSWFLRVYIERDSGLGLLECQEVSERLGVLLDVEDPIESSYTLEVSSPGLDRPLRNERDYARFAGRLARIKTREPIEGRSSFRGRLLGVEWETVLLDEQGQELAIPLAVVASGRLEVEIFPDRRAKAPVRARKRS